MVTGPKNAKDRTRQIRHSSSRTCLRMHPAFLPQLLASSSIAHFGCTSTMEGSVASELSPARFLATENVVVGDSTAAPDLLILNQPIAHFDAFARLWNHTGYRVCADGGANRLFDMFEGDLASQRETYVGRMSSKTDNRN